MPLIATAAMLPRIYLGLLGLPVAAGAREPGDARLVVPPRLDSHRHLDRHRHDRTRPCSCRASDIAPRAPGASWSGFWRRFCWCSFCSRCTASGRGASATTCRSAVELLVRSAAMVLPWIIGGAFSDRWWRPWTWIAAAAAGLVGRLRGLVGASLPHRARAPRSAGVRGHRSADVAGAAVSADHRLHRSREPRHVRRRPRVVGARRGLDSHHRHCRGWSQPRSRFSVRWRSTRDSSHSGSRTAADASGLGLFTILSGGAAYRLIAALASQARRWRFATATRAVPRRAGDDDPADRARLGRKPSAASVHSRPPPLSRAAAPGRRVAARGSSRALRPARARRRSRTRHLDQSVLAARDVSRAGSCARSSGVSRPKDDRHPSAFTGFDAADDMPFEPRSATVGRPLHVVNTTLNLVADNRLAVAERKATSFTMSPLHAGSQQLGYRPAADLRVGHHRSARR